MSADEDQDTPLIVVRYSNRSRVKFVAVGVLFEAFALGYILPIQNTVLSVVINVIAVLMVLGIAGLLNYRLEWYLHGLVVRRLFGAKHVGPHEISSIEFISVPPGGGKRDQRQVATLEEAQRVIIVTSRGKIDLDKRMEGIGELVEVLQRRGA